MVETPARMSAIENRRGVGDAARVRAQRERPRTSLGFISLLAGSIGRGLEPLADCLVILLMHSAHRTIRIARMHMYRIRLVAITARVWAPTAHANVFPVAATGSVGDAAEPELLGSGGGGGVGTRSEGYSS
ncbi:hypothetical protein BJY52DRAFT_1417402 [Lactarius psammicola]|nr:hypothetical protein BJY52DRAFT_1417402 [Lactarius psammicola]